MPGHFRATCPMLRHEAMKQAKPDVTKWAKQYDSKLGRNVFLILDGESWIGKTRFALNLQPLGSTAARDAIEQEWNSRSDSEEEAPSSEQVTLPEEECVNCEKK